MKLTGGQSISYPAADGTRVSAYLTLPPGQEQEKAKSLPAVVLPPGAANGDTAAFDWLAQFFASRGYAVLRLGRYGDGEVHGWSNSSLRKESVGAGPNMHAGSPIEHVDRITAPVLLFHGELDREVSVEESKRLAARLTGAGKSCKLVTWQDLDDDLADSNARAEMLRTSDEFIRQTLGLGSGAAAQP